MFIFNLNLNKPKLAKLFISITLVIILLIMCFSIYIVFFKHNNDCCSAPEKIIELDETNYTTFLKSANENIDSYVGMKFCVTGYIYRLLDFKENEFVIARDMRIGKDSQYVVVGFLCNYDKASSFEDGTWVNVTGKIKKGHFNNSNIAILKVTSIEKTNQPENVFVNPPNATSY